MSATITEVPSPLSEVTINEDSTVFSFSSKRKDDVEIPVLRKSLHMLWVENTDRIEFHDPQFERRRVMTIDFVDDIANVTLRPRGKGATKFSVPRDFVREIRSNSFLNS